MKKELAIEWQHIGADVSDTCERCAATGTTLQQVLKDLRPYFAQKNIRMVFKETVLPDDQLPDSNRILINGKALEDCLDNARVKQTPCCSCSCITGKDSVPFSSGLYQKPGFIVCQIEPVCIVPDNNPKSGGARGRDNFSPAVI